MRINIRAGIPALILGSLLAIPSYGSSIVLGVTGAINVGTTTIEFGTTKSGGPYAAPGSQGMFTVTEPIGPLFASNGIMATDVGKITSLSSAMEPIGQPVAPVDFLNFVTHGSNLVLYLTQLNAGSAIGPFNLADTSVGATASFSVLGVIDNTKDGSVTPYEGLFSATFAGTTVQQLLTEVPGGVITPYSGTFSITTLTPEPASLLLMGVGLLGAGVIARKKIRS